MRICALVIAVVFSGSVAAAPAWRYAVSAVTVTDLGTLGGLGSTALDINDRGEIIGWSATTSGVRHAFLYRSGAMEDIGASFGAADTVATGINNNTQVVGHWSSTKSGVHAFRWQSGSVRSLVDTILVACTPTSEAYAINDTGYIAGRVYCNGNHEAVRWLKPDSPQLLESKWPFIWNSVAYDINNPGALTGRTKDVEQMVRWNADLSVDVILPPAGTYDPGYPDDGARAINDAGAVVGKTQLADGTWRAFLWPGPGLASSDLGLLPGGFNSYADDLNEQYFIAGSGDVLMYSSWPLYITRNLGFLYHSNFGKFALPTLPDTSLFGSCETHALNERNTTTGLIQIVGYCDTNGGARRAVRWDVTVVLVSTLPPKPTP